MGGAVSSGVDNDSLVDNLIKAEYICTPQVERVFRAVDRGFYYTESHQKEAYKDTPWKYKNLHLSAPCIYTKVMEALEFKPGQSFLNLGSGTGYLSTMAGLLIGPFGVNHGIELHEDAVTYAEKRLEEFMKTQVMDEFDFSEPIFSVGNCLSIPAGSRRYDRVYCGAACSVEWKQHIQSLVEIGGILVLPVEDQLLKITRKGESKWESKGLLTVTFAQLVTPDVQMKEARLPQCEVPFLDNLVRSFLRRKIRRQIDAEHPELWRKMRRAPRRKESGEHDRYSEFSIVPIPIMSDSDDAGDSDMEPDYLPRMEVGCELWRLTRQLVNRTRRRENEEGDDGREHFVAEDEGVSSDEEWLPENEPRHREETESELSHEELETEDEAVEVEQENHQPPSESQPSSEEVNSAQTATSSEGVRRRSKFDSGVADLSDCSSSFESHHHPHAPDEEETVNTTEETISSPSKPTRMATRCRPVPKPETEEILEEPHPLHHCTGTTEGEYTKFMQEKIDSLPLPPRLKAYLNFFRPLGSVNQAEQRV